MQQKDAAARAEGPKPQKAPRWRDLTDEQRWERIYKDRELKRAAAPRTVAEATALSLPAYVLQMTVDDCQKTFTASLRRDVHISIVTTIARVAQLLRTEADREAMLNRLHSHYMTIKGKGFYTGNKEFLYANAVALVKLVDDYRYPPDAPVVGAAILLKEDAEDHDDGDWGLAKDHALRMADTAYDEYLRTELYAYPTGKLHG